LEAPDAPWPANGQNQEGARELRVSAVKRPHTRAAYAWAHLGSPREGDGDRSRKEPRVALVCIGRHPDPRSGSQPCFRVLDGFWVTTLRTSLALVIASPVSPLHLAPVAARCREIVEAANVLVQLLRHPTVTVCGLRQCLVGSKSCGRTRRTLFWLTAKRECAGARRRLLPPRNRTRSTATIGALMRRDCPLHLSADTVTGSSMCQSFPHLRREERTTGALVLRQ